MPRIAAYSTKYPSNAIRRHRKRTGIKRNDLAALLRIAPITLWRWETGQAHPTWDNLKNLATALHTTPAALLPAMTQGATGSAEDDTARAPDARAGRPTTSQRAGAEPRGDEP